MPSESDIASWFRGAIDWIADVGRHLFQSGKEILSNLPIPTLPSGSGGGSGGGSTPGTPGTPGGGTSPGTSPDVPTGGGLFSDTIHVLRSLTETETWTRVGVVILGVVFIFLALVMMLRRPRPIAAIMERIGVA